MGVNVFPSASTGGSVTWTAISTPTIAGTTAVDFTSLSGYKEYKIVFSNLSLASSGPIMVRLNANSSTYTTTGEAGTASTSSGSNHINSSEFYATGSLNVTSYLIGSVTIPQANLVGNKSCVIDTGFTDGGVAKYFKGNGTIQTTAAITQIRVFANSNFDSNGVTLYGGN
jgi:hypothetical protein